MRCHIYLYRVMHDITIIDVYNINIHSYRDSNIYVDIYIDIYMYHIYTIYIYI